MHEVLQFLVTPETCYHSFMETYFERESRPKTECGQFCSYCLGQIKGFTKRVYKKKLISLISAKLLNSTKVTCKAFVNALKSEKQTIFHEKDVSGKKMFQIHALGLQLVAKGIIALSISDTTKIGTKDLCGNHLIVVLPNVDDDGILMPAYLVDKCWEGLNTIEEEVADEKVE